MADFNDVVKQLQANNEAEKSRDSNLNRNIASLRASNKEAFSDFITSQQQNTKVSQELVDSQSSNKAAEIEISKESNFKDEKQQTIFEKISEGISGIGNSMKESFTKFTGGSGKFGSLIRGTLFAGLLIAVAMWLNSESFKSTVDYITNTLIPMFDNFWEKTVKPFGKGIAGFIGNPSWENFKKIFDVENPLGLVAGIVGITTLLAPKLMFGALKKGVGLFSKAFGLLGKSLPGFAPKVPKGGLPGSKGGLPGIPTKAQGITKTAGSFAKMGASAGKGIGGFIGGILKGIASGLMAFAAPPVIAGLAAVTIALIALEDSFEPIGKMVKEVGAGIKKVFEGIGSVVESMGKSIKSIIVGIGEAIGNVIDKISSMSTAGTEATTKQIKELSQIPSDKMFSAAKGIDAMKAALDGFGGGTFTKIANSLFGGDGPIDKILDLAKDVPALMKAAEAINVIAAVGGNYAMAESELKRREKVAELEKGIAAGSLKGEVYTSDNDLKAAKAELAALKKQGIESNKPYASGLINNSTTARIANESKANQMLQSGQNNKSAAPTIINNANVKTANNTSNSTTSSTSYIGNPDQAFAMSAGSF